MTESDNINIIVFKVVHNTILRNKIKYLCINAKCHFLR